MFNIEPYQFLEWKLEEFCCGDYVLLLLKDRFGVNLPPAHFEGGPIQAAAKVKSLPYRDLFDRIDEPKEWCVVEMQRHRPSDHVGMCVIVGDKLMITHCERNAGVLLNTFAEIQEHYKIVGFYEYRS